MSITREEYARLMRKANAHAKVAALLLDWAETTHGNEFGHDHHCPVPHDYNVGAWASEPGDPEKCTCGWSAFRAAFDAYNTEFVGD